MGIGLQEARGKKDPDLVRAAEEIRKDEEELSEFERQRREIERNSQIMRELYLCNQLNLSEDSIGSINKALGLINSVNAIKGAQTLASRYSENGNEENHLQLAWEVVRKYQGTLNTRDRNDVDLHLSYADSPDLRLQREIAKSEMRDILPTRYAEALSQTISSIGATRGDLSAVLEGLKLKPGTLVLELRNKINDLLKELKESEKALSGDEVYVRGRNTQDDNRV